MAGILFERGIDQNGFAIIRSKGDLALFNLSTTQLKKKLGIPDNRPVADFLPTISIKAKDLASEMTSMNVQIKDINGHKPVEKEHVDNNSAVRKMLLARNILPENLPVDEDVKKVQRKLSTERKKVFKRPKRK